MLSGLGADVVGVYKCGACRDSSKLRPARRIVQMLQGAAPRIGRPGRLGANLRIYFATRRKLALARPDLGFIALGQHALNRLPVPRVAVSVQERGVSLIGEHIVKARLKTEEVRRLCKARK